MYTADALYSKLAGEHVEGQCFRGQVREYPGPLWPSDYRDLFSSADCLDIEDDSRIRESGTRFHLRLDSVDWQRFASQEDYVAYVRKQQIKRFIMGHVRNALGYPLAEVLFQQAGMRSEGLDVTDDVKVAFFFAVYEWDGDGRYRLKSESHAPSVIYRWSLPPRVWGPEALNRYDFYSCPPLIPACDILSSLAECETLEQSAESLDAFREAIGWGLGFDLDRVRGRRPFHLIKLPASLLRGGRVVSQRAALLLPDAVTAEAFLGRHRVTSPDVLQEILNGMFLEDLSQSPTCERFTFDASDIEGAPWFAAVDPATIFPRDELLFSMLRGWTRTLIQNPSGTVPIWADMPAGIPFDELIELLVHDYETAFFV